MPCQQQRARCAQVREACRAAEQQASCGGSRPRKPRLRSAKPAASPEAAAAAARLSRRRCLALASGASWRMSMAGVACPRCCRRPSVGDGSSILTDFQRSTFERRTAAQGITRHPRRVGAAQVATACRLKIGTRCSRRSCGWHLEIVVCACIAEHTSAGVGFLCSERFLILRS